MSQSPATRNSDKCQLGLGAILRTAKHFSPPPEGHLHARFAKKFKCTVTSKKHGVIRLHLEESEWTGLCYGMWTYCNGSTSFYNIKQDILSFLQQRGSWSSESFPEHRSRWYGLLHDWGLRPLLPVHFHESICCAGKSRMYQMVVLPPTHMHGEMKNHASYGVEEANEVI